MRVRNDADVTYTADDRECLQRSDPIVSTTQHVVNGIIAFLDITFVRRRTDGKRSKRCVRSDRDT